MTANTASLPPQWRRATLPELVAEDGVLTDGDWVESIDQDRDGEVRLTQLADVGDGYFRDRSDRYMTRARAAELRCTFLQKGDVLIARMPDPLGRACLFPGARRPCVTVVDVCIVRPGSAPVHTPWLMHFINAPQFRAEVASLQAGSTRKRISKANLSTIALPVPPPAEQREIAATIDSHFSRLDAATATLERVQRNLERYRASVLKAAVEGRLVPTEAELARKEGRSFEPASVLLKRILAERRRRWEEAELAKLKAKGKPPTDDRWKARYVEPAAPDTTGLPELPGGWCWATLPMLGEIDRGRSRHRPRNDPRLLGGPHPFIQTGDVRSADGFIRSFSATYSDFGLAQSRRWSAGTLCITIAANIAETAILGFDACFPDSIVGFVNAERPVLIRFIELFIRTAREKLERFAPATAQKNINLQTLTEVAVPLPPEAEIRRIVDCVDAEMDRTRRVADDSMRSALAITRLRQSILKWAFDGRLVNAEQDGVLTIASSQP